MFNHVSLLATPWSVTCQAPLSMGFPRQEAACCFQPQEISPTQGSNLHLSVILRWQADSSPLREAPSSWPPLSAKSFCDMRSGEVRSPSGLSFPWWNHHWGQKQTPSSWLCPPGAGCPSGASVTLMWQGENGLLAVSQMPRTLAVLIEM